MTPLSPQCALAKVIEIAGGPAAVAKVLEISSQAVSQWEVAPPARVRRLVELANGEVSEADLRPDIFGPEGRAQ
jgi:DNA-binding transcriptional regulator YdaS (Cro superfamily)